jgi:hypothetical protein
MIVSYISWKPSIKRKGIVGWYWSFFEGLEERCMRVQAPWVERPVMRGSTTLKRARAWGMGRER